MRKENLYGWARADALAFLERAATVHVATTGPDGEPILRELNAACLDGRIWFHGAPVGEKTLALGRPAVIAASEIVAEIPSHWIDPERACPATTLYRSVQVHGVLEEVGDRVMKGRALEALMQKHQPEGGYAPLAEARYDRELEGLLLIGVSLERLDGKAKLAQNRNAAVRANILTRLWERGRPGDPRAIDLISRANGDRFGDAPAGTTFVFAPDPEHARAVAELLAPTYWNDVFSKEQIAAAHLASDAWVVLEDERGVVASARAVSDREKHAWIYDVIVREDRRGQGLGDSIMRRLLDHPAVRGARFQHLGTRDAMAFYERMGFGAPPARPYASTHMVRVQPSGSR